MVSKVRLEKVIPSYPKCISQSAAVGSDLKHPSSVFYKSQNPKTTDLESHGYARDRECRDMQKVGVRLL